MSTLEKNVQANDAELQSRAERLLRRISRLVRQHNPDPNLLDYLRESIQRLGMPLRVAVVGDIKTGKSTLMNALLGQKLLATGVTETTFNVSWFRYGDRSELSLRRKDGSQRKNVPLDQLDSIIRREGDHEDHRDTSWVEIRQPHPMLRQVEWIDTPGLHSWFQEDSQNTAEFLGLSDGSDLLDRQPDALIYMFAQNLSEADLRVIHKLAASADGRVNPLNTIGVMSKCDLHWQPQDGHPFVTAQRIIDRLRAEHPGLNRVLWSLEPVMALMAENGQRLTGEDLAALRQLAAMDQSQIGRSLRSARRFRSPDLSCSVDWSRRQQLHNKLGLYGVGYVLACLRANPNADMRQLSELCQKESGVRRLQEVVFSHFVKRSLVLKLCRILRRLRALAAVSDESRLLPSAAVAAIEEFQEKEPALQEVEILFQLSSGRMQMDEQECLEIRRLCGEMGQSWQSRLGLTTAQEIVDEDLQQLVKRRASVWRKKQQSPLNAGMRVQLCRFAIRMYQRLAHQINCVRRR